MTSNSQSAVAYIYLSGTGYVPAGRVSFDAARNTCRFSYGKKYVRRNNALPIDPVKLPLWLSAETETPPGFGLLSAFRDATPDHWGRKLLSLMSGKHVQELNEFDYLTAGFTTNKVGALAFGPDPRRGPQSMAPWFDVSGFVRGTEDLAKIAHVIRQVDEAEDDELEDLRRTLPRDDFMRALALNPSIGGVRPKCILRKDGREYIVKFSKASDLWNEPLIEHATMKLARKCGINAAQTHVKPLGDGNCLMVSRFDRNDDGEPRHFVSGYALGNLEEQGDWKSYQHLAQGARKYGDPLAGEQLFRRMVFNILVSNIDDHPRNQAFFVHRESVELTPAYDIVPTSWDRKAYNLALRVGDKGTAATLENALSNVVGFGLDDVKAADIIVSMMTTCRSWREEFAGLGIKDKDIERLGSRFRVLQEHTREWT